MKFRITCCALFVTILIHAQGTEPGWHFGIKTDLNFSTIKGKGMADGYTTGAQFGGFAEKRLSRQWTFQPEVLFTQSNTKKANDFTTYYNTEGNVFASDNIKLGYISVPLMMKYNVNKFIAVMAGPQYSQLLFDAESLVQDSKGVAFKRYEVSANAGLQFTVGNVSLYGRYNLGLSNINAIDDRYKWRSRHLQVGIAIRIK
ncbi:MAG: porin family protein [Chitinophagaceae bacterium]